MTHLRTVLSVAVLVAGPSGALAQDAAAQGVGALVIERSTRVVLRLTDSITSSSSQSSEPALVTVNDLVVDGVVVVPHGSAASFTVKRQAARSLGRRGTLTLNVEGIYTSLGDVVLPLQWTQTREGTQCYDKGCMVLLLAPQLKGGEAAFGAGTLLSAIVTQTTTFDEAAINRLAAVLSRPATNHGASANGARLHVYSISGGTVKVDGQRMGDVAAQQYGCWALSPGNHRIQLAAGELPIVARSGGEHYVRDSQLDGRTSVMETAGFQFNEELLELAGRARNQVPCW